MIIQYLGHSCFRLESKDISCIIDPFSKEIGIRAPRINDNIVLVSHSHYDHNNIQGAPSNAFVVQNPGEYEVKNIYLRGIRSYHDKSQGAERGPNNIYVIDIEEIKVCHLGDLGQEKLTDSQVDEIGDIDVLMIPVGGTYTINYKEASEIVNQIEPKIVIPMHYKVRGLKLDIDGPEKFIKELGLTPEKVDKLKLAKKLLPSEEMKLVVFENA